MMDMSHLNPDLVTKEAKEVGKNIGGIYNSFWIKLHVFDTALMQEILDSPHTPDLQGKNEKDTMQKILHWVIRKSAKDLGIETG